MKNFNGPFCEKLLVSVKKKKKKRSRSNDFGSDEYSYSIYIQIGFRGYPSTRSSPNEKVPNLSINDFYCVFVRTEINFIAFLVQAIRNMQPYLGQQV